MHKAFANSVKQAIPLTDNPPRVSQIIQTSKANSLPNDHHVYRGHLPRRKLIAKFVNSQPSV